MPIFRVRTISGVAALPQVRTDVAIETANLTEARRRADAIAQAEPLWRPDDAIEILTEDEHLLATRRRGRRWRTFRSSPG
jgi:hypothetical protein